MKHHLIPLTASVALVFGALPSRAEPAVGLACLLSGPGVAACAAAGLGIHEAIQAANGKQPFGPNGEVAKLIKQIPDEATKAPPIVPVLMPAAVPAVAPIVAAQKIFGF